MFVSDSNLAGQLAALGNIPGDHQGDCLIRLPGGGQHTVDSASLRLFTKGVIGQLPDGRRSLPHQRLAGDRPGPRGRAQWRPGGAAVTVAAARVPATPPAEPITLAPPGLSCSCCWSAGLTRSRPFLCRRAWGWSSWGRARTRSSAAACPACMTASGCARRSWRPSRRCASGTATVTSPGPTGAGSCPRLPEPSRSLPVRTWPPRAHRGPARLLPGDQPRQRREPQPVSR
jgi:hypothetical protein